MFVLVTGPPGSGKTTLAVPLAEKLGLPLIAKDVIKESLMATLGMPGTVEESRRIGRAASAVMIAVAKCSPGAVLENAFATFAAPTLGTLPGMIIEVRCRCSREVALARYRARTAGRHEGHLDDLRDANEIWNNELTTPLGLGPLIEVDTETEVEVDEVVDRIRALADS